MRSRQCAQKGHAASDCVRVTVAEPPNAGWRPHLARNEEVRRIAAGLRHRETHNVARIWQDAGIAVLEPQPKPVTQEDVRNEELLRHLWRDVAREVTLYYAEADNRPAQPPGRRPDRSRPRARPAEAPASQPAPARSKSEPPRRDLSQHG